MLGDLELVNLVPAFFRAAEDFAGDDQLPRAAGAGEHRAEFGGGGRAGRLALDAGRGGDGADPVDELLPQVFLHSLVGLSDVGAQRLGVLRDALDVGRDAGAERWRRHWLSRLGERRRRWLGGWLGALRID